MLDEDIGLFFGDLAVEATFSPLVGSPQTAAVYLDEPDGVFVVEMVVAREIGMTYPAGVFATLKEGDTLTVNGAAHRVKTIPQRLADGRLMRAELARV